MILGINTTLKIQKILTFEIFMNLCLTCPRIVHSPLLCSPFKSQSLNRAMSKLRINYTVSFVYLGVSDIFVSQTAASFIFNFLAGSNDFISFSNLSSLKFWYHSSPIIKQFALNTTNLPFSFSPESVILVTVTEMSNRFPLTEMSNEFPFISSIFLYI